ncbi:MAG: stage V sporulation T C-terminal domain-containing protein [Anaerostipes sp.]|nr:stage V sporulation T C-terminal domain-containing protein [Anaerostipes sp.]
MKATGIVRRIDNLGRIVIPKEIRKTLRIHEGDPLEIFIEQDGKIILGKYSPFEELGAFAKSYVDAIARNIPHTICICDLYSVIASAGPNSKQLNGKDLNSKVIDSMEHRIVRLSTKSENTFIPITSDFPEEFISEAFATIISEGDAIGSVFILSLEESLSEHELEVAKISADFLGQQLA